MNHKNKSAFMLLAPSVIILACTTFIPMIYTLGISFYEYDLKKGPNPTDFIGANNYIKAFSDTAFWNRVGTTLVYTVMSVSLTILLGLAISLLLQKSTRFHTGLKMLLIFPYAMSPAVKGYLWRFMLTTGGFYDNVLAAIFPFTADFNWLGTGPSALFWLATTEIWGWAPMVALMFIGALGSISPSVFEAAALDGVKNYEMFRYITLPLLKPIIMTTTVLKTIFSLKMFDTVVTMTGGGPGDSTQTLNYFIHQQGFRYLNMGYASALAIILVVIVLVLVWTYVRFRKKEVA